MLASRMSVVPDELMTIVQQNQMLTSFAIAFTVLIAIMKRERPFGLTFNYWDKAVTYAAVFCLARIFIDAAPA
jgi:hypothetical protein